MLLFNNIYFEMRSIEIESNSLSSDFLRRPEKLEEIVHLICFFTSLIRNLFFCQVSKKKKFKSGFLINQHSRLDELFACWSDEKKRFLSKGLHW